MNAETIFPSLQTMAESNQWVYLWPQIALVVLGLGLLVLEMLLPRKRVGTLVPAVALAGFALIGVLVCTPLFPTLADSLTVFDGMLLSPLSPGIFLFFIASSFLTGYLSMVCLPRQVLPRTEYFAVLSFVTAAILVLIHANNFLMMFVALETVTIGLYVLVGYARGQMTTLEAALKYLLTGAMSSAMLLFGIVLLYGAGAIKGIADPLNYQSVLQLFKDAQLGAGDSLALCGVALTLCAVAFKLGAVPFHIWVPDVYQGALTPTTAFLAVSSKAAGFVVLLCMLMFSFDAQSLKELLIPLLSLLAALSILFGNLGALSQRNVKRLMGLSGVSHAGYLLLGVVAYLTLGHVSMLYAIAFYLLAYMLASYAVFGVMSHVATNIDDFQEMQDYRMLLEKCPFLGGVLCVGLGSLAGIPPCAGFIGKLLIFICAVQAQLYWLLGIGIFGVVVSIYYYFGWMRAAVYRPWRSSQDSSSGKIPMESAQPSPEVPSVWSRLVLGALAAAVLLLGLFQGSLVSDPANPRQVSSQTSVPQDN